MTPNVAASTTHYIVTTLQAATVKGLHAPCDTWTRKGVRTWDSLPLSHGRLGTKSPVHFVQDSAGQGTPPPGSPTCSRTLQRSWRLSWRGRSQVLVAGWHGAGRTPSCGRTSGGRIQQTCGQHSRRRLLWPPAQHVRHASVSPKPAKTQLQHALPIDPPSQPPLNPAL